MFSDETWVFNFGKLLLGLGEDLDREGLQETPKRVDSAWHEFLLGYTLEPEKILATTFDAETDGIQVCENVSFCSMCEHHLLPFFGSVTIVYRPDKRVAGLSKLPRLVDCFARRLQIQERMTQQIADTLMEYIVPKGVLVCCKARHHCCHGRGVRRTSMRFKTFAQKGIIEPEFWEVLRC